MTSQELEDKEFFIKIAGLILFITAFYGYQNPIYHALSTSFFVIFLIKHDAIDWPFYWLGLIGIFIPIIVYGWEFVGNQKFIHLYILLFMFMISIYKVHRDDLLKFCSIFCVLLIFGVACIWKWSLSEFRSGDFLTFLILSGSIFDFYTASFQALVRGTDIPAVYETILHKNQDAIQLLNNNTELQGIILTAPDSLILFGKIMTFIALATQTIIPISLVIYLKTKKQVWINIMHIFMCEFILVAYYPTKVIGFGMLLCVLGLILAHYYAPKYKKVYYALFILLILFDLPLHNMIFLKYPMSYITGY